MTEQELIRKVQNGETQLLGEIIEAYYDDILRFCRYQTGDESSAYDLTQETFLKFIKYIGSFRYRNLKGYLLTIAGNLCRDYFKARVITEPLEKVAESGEEDKALNGTDSRLLLESLLAKLPGEQREVMILKYYNDCKLTEIARILGVNLSTVKSRLRLGTRAMKKEMEELDER